MAHQDSLAFLKEVRKYEKELAQQLGMFLSANEIDANELSADTLTEMYMRIRGVGEREEVLKLILKRKDWEPVVMTLISREYSDMDRKKKNSSVRLKEGAA